MYYVPFIIILHAVNAKMYTWTSSLNGIHRREFAKYSIIIIIIVMILFSINVLNFMCIKQ